MYRTKRLFFLWPSLWPSLWPIISAIPEGRLDGVLVAEFLGGLSELSGTMLEAFWDDCRGLFLSLLRVLWKSASSSVSIGVGTFWFTSFAKFAKLQGSFPLQNSLLFCILFFDA